MAQVECVEESSAARVRDARLGVQARQTNGVDREVLHEMVLAKLEAVRDAHTGCWIEQIAESEHAVSQLDNWILRSFQFCSLNIPFCLQDFEIESVVLL